MMSSRHLSDYIIVAISFSSLTVSMAKLRMPSESFSVAIGSSFIIHLNTCSFMSTRVKSAAAAAAGSSTLSHTSRDDRNTTHCDCTITWRLVRCWQAAHPAAGNCYIHQNWNTKSVSYLRGDGQTVAARKRQDFALVAERGTHDDSFVTEFLVVSVNLADADDAGVGGASKCLRRSA